MFCSSVVLKQEEASPLYNKLRTLSSTGGAKSFVELTSFPTSTGSATGGGASTFFTSRARAAGGAKGEAGAVGSEAGDNGSGNVSDGGVTAADGGCVTSEVGVAAADGGRGEVTTDVEEAGDVEAAEGVIGAASKSWTAFFSFLVGSLTAIEYSSVKNSSTSSKPDDHNISSISSGSALGKRRLSSESCCACSAMTPQFSFFVVGLVVNLLQSKLKNLMVFPEKKFSEF